MQTLQVFGSSHIFPFWIDTTSQDALPDLLKSPVHRILYARMELERIRTQFRDPNTREHVIVNFYDFMKRVAIKTV